MKKQHFLCKILGHRYFYFKDVATSPSGKYRVCTRCAELAKLSDQYAPAYPKNWFAMVRYTPRGAKEELKEFYK